MVEQVYFSAEIRLQLTETEVALWRSQHGQLASVPSLFSPPIDQPELILNFSMSYSAADNTSLYLFLPTVADVAVNSTPLAIIVQRAEKLGCWEDEDFQWRKPQQQVCREGGGRVSTNDMVRDMDVPSVGVWRFKAVGNR